MKMMILPFLLILLVSCSGDIENKTSNDPTLRLGSALSEDTNKILSAVEHSYLNKICDSFEIKDGLVPGLFDSKSWVYKTTYNRCSDKFRDCGGPVYTGDPLDYTFFDPNDAANATQLGVCDSSEVSLNMNGSGASKSLSTSNSSADRYYFTDYLSHEQGLIKDLCAKRSEVEVKKIHEPGTGVRAKYSFYSGSGACDANPHVLCIDIDYAVKNQANQYIVEYIHTVKVETESANPNNQRGVVKERFLYEMCSSGYQVKASSFLRHQ